MTTDTVDNRDPAPRRDAFHDRDIDIDILDEGLLILDERRQIVSINRALGALLGCSRETVIGSSVTDFLQHVSTDSATRDRLASLLSEDHESGSPSPFPCGETKWYEHRRQLLGVTSSGSRTLHRFFDVTDRVQPREPHREAESILELHQEITDVLLGADSIGSLARQVVRTLRRHGPWLAVRSWSLRPEGWQRLSIVDPEGLDVPDSLDTTWQNDLGEGRPRWRRLEGPCSESFRGQLILPAHPSEGASFALEFLSTDAREPSRPYLEALTRIGKQIGQAYRRVQTTARLRQRVDRLYLLTDNLPVMIAYVDSERRYRFVNAAYERWFGIHRKDIIGHPVSEVLDHYEAIRPHIERVLNGETAHDEYRLRHTDGSIRDVESTLVPNIGRKGTVAGYFVLVRDITMRKRADEDRRILDAKIQESQKLESLGNLAGGIAHDFNNLLTGVLGNVGLVLMDLAAKDPLRETVLQIELAARRAADLTHQMLAYSGRGKFLTRRLDLRELIENMRHLLEASVSKKVRLALSTGVGPIPVDADPDQLRQVVMNLVVNASESLGSHAGTINIRLTVQSSSQAPQRRLVGTRLGHGPCVALEIADTGCGIDPSMLEKIFEPFFSTKFTGRGLGLAATMGIVRGHHGALEVESVPERGSTFRVLLPLATEAAKPIERSRRVERKGTILVVDDEEMVRDLADRALTKFGFSVITARDGHEGLELFERHQDQVAAVLLDLTMPRMSGKEVFREIARMKPETPVILSSGYAKEEVSRHFGGTRPSRFLQKPYPAHELVDEVRWLLQKPRPSLAPPLAERAEKVEESGAETR